MSTLPLSEAQARLSDVIHNLNYGEEVLITENELVIARIVSDRRPLHKRPDPGLCKGMITVLSEDDEHLDDFKEYMP